MGTAWPLSPAISPWTRTSSIPAPAVIGATLPCRAVSWSRSASTCGQMCSQTWLVSSRAPPRSVVRARRTASRQLARARSTCGSAVTLPVSSRTTTSWRTWARATSRWSCAVVAGDGVEEQDVLGRLEPGELEVAQPPQVEPPADHRVDVAHRAVLLDRAVGQRAEGEVADLAVVGGDDARRRPGGRPRRTASRPAAARGRRRRRRGRPGGRASGGRGRRPPRSPRAGGRRGR